MDEITFPSKVWNREHSEFGVPTQTVQKCRLDGCPSIRVGVRWPDGALTWPCMRGMDTSSTTDWQIL